RRPKTDAFDDTVFRSALALANFPPRLATTGTPLQRKVATSLCLRGIYIRDTSASATVGRRLA
ncbi:MAG: hypothetical protein WA796_24470, partial [Pseudolabrys sp.]